MEIVQLHDKTFKKFISNQDIQSSIDDLVSKINSDYNNCCPVFIGVLNGSFLFCADLVKRFNGNCEIAFIRVASYQGLASSGQVKEILGLTMSLKNRDVIILEDIVEMVILFS